MKRILFVVVLMVVSGCSAYVTRADLDAAVAKQNKTDKLIVLAINKLYADTLPLVQKNKPKEAPKKK